MPWGYVPGVAGSLHWSNRPLTPAERRAEVRRVAASKRRRAKMIADAHRRRGLIYALRSSGATTAEIARAAGCSWPRVRQIEAEIDRAIHRAADRRFPLPRWHDWEGYARGLARSWGA